VLREAIRANRLLAELKGFCQTLPNPEILLRTVILQESRDSSAVENIVTTQDELFRAAADRESLKSATPEAKEVMRYTEAVDEGMRQMERTGAITTAVMVRVMQVLKNTTAEVRQLPGTKLVNPTTGRVTYTPPEGEALLRDKLARLEQFLNMHEEPPYDPLVMMALMHYQFEAIHPFADGNGRTGRILNVLYLLQTQRLSVPILYLSGFVMQHRDEYYRRLREVTEKDAWGEWVLYMLRAVAETSIGTLDRVRRMQELRAEYLERARDAVGRAPAREIVDLMFSYPYLKINTLVNQAIGGRQAVSRYLHSLAKGGLLMPIKAGRDIYFVNHRLMALFSEPLQIVEQ